jgi:hypothetical protein
MRTLATSVRTAGLWFSVVDAVPIDEAFITRVRDAVTAAYVGWDPEA